MTLWHSVKTIFLTHNWIIGNLENRLFIFPSNCILIIRVQVTTVEIVVIVKISFFLFINLLALNSTVNLYFRPPRAHACIVYRIQECYSTNL